MLLAACGMVGGLLIGGGAVGLLARPQTTIVALAPAPIAMMAPWSTVAIKGEVAELFGGRFVLQDGSGRALVDPGPASDDAADVTKDETVTVQGRFERGVVHAIAISHADGRTDLVGPPGPPEPRRWPLAWLDRQLGRGHWFRAAPPAASGTGSDT